MVKVRKDLTGQRFGRLVVIRQSENDYISPKGKHFPKWWCQCDCNNEEVEIRGSELTSGHTTSCGCYQKEKVAEIGRLRKTENRYEKKDGYYVGYTDKDEPFYFDEDDFYLIKQYKWHIRSDGYVESFRKERDRILMHRLIMKDFITDKDLVDHILGKETKNDNRKYNLRVVTSSQNNTNRTIGSNNKSGFLGVCYNERFGTWRAYITVNKKRFHLGTYKNLEDAVKVRKEAENILQGDFSYKNSQLIGNKRLNILEQTSNIDYQDENVS